MVRLAVTGENRALQKQLRQKSKDGPTAVIVSGGEAYAALPRKEFVKRTEQYNQALSAVLKAQLENAE
jgi:phosphatidylglycerol:prolipoprotein diacylglycerol transferase